MLKSAVLALAAAAVLSSAASAATPTPIKRTDRGAISNIVTVPPGYALSFVSGTTMGSGGPPTPEGADTKTQAIAIYQKMKGWLEAEGLSLGDIVMMRVYLAADPKTGRMDTQGANEAYAQFFGTAQQPNKPARVTLQVGGLGGRSLVEIEAQAAHPVK